MDVCVDTDVDVCVDMCMGLCVCGHVCGHVYRHVCADAAVGRRHPILTPGDTSPNFTNFSTRFSPKSTGQPTSHCFIELPTVPVGALPVVLTWPAHTPPQKKKVPAGLQVRAYQTTTDRLANVKTRRKAGRRSRGGAARGHLLRHGGDDGQVLAVEPCRPRNELRPMLGHVHGHALRHVLGHVLRHALRHVLGHVFRHALGHVLGHALRHVLRHVLGHVLKTCA